MAPLSSCADVNVHFNQFVVLIDISPYTTPYTLYMEIAKIIVNDSIVIDYIRDASDISIISRVGLYVKRIV